MASMKCSTSSRMATSRKAQLEVAAVARPSVRPVASRRSPAPFTAAPVKAGVSRSLRTAAAAAAPAGAAQSSAQGTKEWYALVANADFWFNDPQNESVAEQLRERVRFFKEQNREIDFWLVPEPKWLDSKFPKEAKQVRRPCVALVSTDKVWIKFMKLRLDRVLRVELGAVEQKEALAKGAEVPEFSKQPNWTAPYPAYSAGWWKVFEPK